MQNMAIQTEMFFKLESQTTIPEYFPLQWQQTPTMVFTWNQVSMNSTALAIMWLGRRGQT